MASGGSRDARVLVTGGHGFVGGRLRAALCERGGWACDAPPGAPGSPGALDVTDADAVEAWIRHGRPDVVVHLAAVAAVTTSTKDPRLAWRVNLQGTLNVVLAMQSHAPDARLLHVSSAEVYGASFAGGEALDETGLLQPVNAYAASKAAADLLVRQAAAEGLRATVMRPFNHIGPGQDEAFAVSSFAAQIARIEAGLQPPVMHVGALDEERDFLDVSDVVDAYMRVLEAPRPQDGGGVFNVASGRAVRIGHVLDRLLLQARAPVQVEVDPARLRRSPVRRVVGDAGALRRAHGWEPRIPLDETLARVLDDQRRRLAAPPPP